MLYKNNIFLSIRAYSKMDVFSKILRAVDQSSLPHLKALLSFD